MLHAQHVGKKKTAGTLYA